MNKAFGALVVVTGLVLAAGCAREDRWTLEGSRPAPIDDRKQEHREAAPVSHAAADKVDFTKENDYCVVKNKGNQPVEVTVQVTPGAKNAAGEVAREIQVLVPATEQVQIGRLKDARGNEWSYRLLAASYK